MATHGRSATVVVEAYLCETATRMVEPYPTCPTPVPLELETVEAEVVVVHEAEVVAAQCT